MSVWVVSQVEPPGGFDPAGAAQALIPLAAAILLAVVTGYLTYLYARHRWRQRHDQRKQASDMHKERERMRKRAGGGK